MKMASRKGLVGGLGVAGVALALGLPAWACTESAYLSSVGAMAHQPRQVMTVAGGNFAKAVELRWGSSNGPVLATAAGPSFSLDVAVPADANPGVYYLVALSRDETGMIAGKATTPIEVDAPRGGLPNIASATGPLGSRSAPAWPDASQALASSQSSSSPALGILLAGAGVLGMTAVGVVAIRRKAPVEVPRR